ncbi:hypothetical protein LQG66_03920 [Bradyrhizobium ontarionense]|uniref:Transcriptional regulator n=1 Tax=Bradyrhizobium ontarionense TaxID=2898149 RepID=A0ABY3RFM7_9BRAD|nr:hypothetical protein [Bradyrhizobium sp. A19]UFZ05474.1 hypothetical protein LQG66_03920 [Bradyrhizobium sp. A19]
MDIGERFQWALRLISPRDRARLGRNEKTLRLWREASDMRVDVVLAVAAQTGVPVSWIIEGKADTTRVELTPTAPGPMTRPLDLFEQLGSWERMALIDVVARGGIERSLNGWDGTITHRHTAIRSLFDSGLCSVSRPGICDATQLGRSVVEAKLGKDVYGAGIAAMDAIRNQQC